MEDQLVTKFVKISLKDQSFAVSADVGEVKDAIQTTFAAIRIEKFDTAGTAMCVVGKALIHKWQWIRTTSIEEDNTLKIEIPRDKENVFKNLLKDGKLQREAKESLEDAETNLEGILGWDAFHESGEKILELIKNIRVSKVEGLRVDGESDSEVVALNLRNSTWQRDEEDVTNIAIDISDRVSGNVTAFAAEGCTISGSAKSNTNLTIKADNVDDAAKLIRTVMTETAKNTERKRKFEEISCADARGKQEKEADDATRSKTHKSIEHTQGTRKIVIKALGRRNKRVNKIPRDAESSKGEKLAIIAYNEKYYSKGKKEAEDEYTKLMPLAFEDPSKQPLRLLSYDDLKNLLKQAKPTKGTSLRIGIAAAAGYGKTTILQRLERDLSRSEKLVVVFLNFHHMGSEEKTSPHKLFFDGLFCDEEQRKQCYKWILENQEDVIFLLDGLDQAEFSLKSKTKHVEDYGEGNTSEIISNILSKDLFPDSKVVFSSREYAMSSLEGALRPDKMISIIGLLRDDSKDLFINKLGENGTDLWNKMEVSLKSLLRIPAFLNFAICVYEDDPKNPPRTLTEVMQRLYRMFVRSENSQCKLTKSQITALRKLCYLGLKNKKLTFKEEDFEDVALDLDQMKDFVIIVPGYGGINCHLLDADKVVIFSHQTIQEFFAGEHIIEMDIDDFRRTVEQDLTSDRWSVITRFVAGLLLNKKSKLEDVQISKLNEKQDILRDMLALKYGEGRAYGGEVASKLSILACMAETEDSDFIQSSVKNINIGDHSIGISGMSSIASVMRHCNYLANLSLCNCTLVIEEAQLLWENIKHSKVKVDNLDVSWNDQLGDGFQYICKLAAHRNVQDLIVEACQLQDCQLSWLKEINSSQLKRLMIYRVVPITTEMETVEDIKEFWTISDTTFASIGNSVAADCDVLLFIRYIVTPSGLNSLKLALDKKKISELDVSYCTLNADCCELIGKIVKQCGVDELIMRGCGITSSAIGCFLAVVKGKKISRLDLSGNNFDADCCEVVANIAMHCSIETLELRNCKINDDALDRFLTSAKGVKLKRLDVKHNYLSSAAIRRIRESIIVENLESYSQVSDLDSTSDSDSDGTSD